ncbi:hypothetical protein Rxycam_02404 [Rubrobacter xylanophilus DSM 9941]|uniref:hypothetical protein n=1 Tax=Rubrobacter xylanophilus TaxID=49319 RepID=UPI001C63E0D8|nr:hypothetical protein [Rubrobacter xylanophilus]QYJ16570.1 hypothetical protein Rxycam_02404 [Rubrobacter xylanophilus DSM 9941]
MSGDWPWIALAALGAYHGLNPAMGWLFAVALGLQERRRGAVLGALPPIALGHAAAVAVALLVLGVARLAVPEEILRYGCAAVLVLFGLYRLIRRRHPRWVGMRVGFRDLVAWSFLMATAHGAGLMLFPVSLGLGHGGHAGHAGMAASGGVSTGVAAVGLHTLAMFAVMAAVAVVVYERLGVMIIKRTWFNLDLLWAGVLVGAGVLTLFV